MRAAELAALPTTDDVRIARAYLSVRMTAREIAGETGWSVYYAQACVKAAKDAWR